MSRPLHKEGGCLVFAWGPPWNWLPSFQRSRYHAGWSLTWLWWGLSFVPVSCSTLMIDGAYPRCPACQKWIDSRYAKPESIHKDCVVDDGG